MPEDFWCPQALLVTVRGPLGEFAVTIDKPFALVGGDPRSDVVLSAGSIPRQRLYLHATSEGVFCVDLVPVKGEEVPAHGWLDPESPVRLGPYALQVRLRDGPAAAGRPEPDAKGTLAGPRPELVLSVDGRQIGSRQLTRQLTIVGRRDPSTLRVTSRSVSACHCALYWDQGLFWAVDLLSTNGSFLDGHPIQVARFPPGASLRLGRVDLAYRVLPPPPGGEAAEDFEALQQPSTQEERQRLEELRQQEEELARQREAWEAERETQRRDLAQRAEQLSAEAAQIVAERQTFQAERERQQRELADRAEHLTAEALRIASERAELARRRDAWEAEHADQAQTLAARADELNTQAGRQQWTTEREALERQSAQEEGKRREGFQRQEAELARQREAWEAEREKHERDLAARTEQLNVEAARIASKQEALEAARAAWHQERQTPEAEEQARRDPWAEQQEALEAERRLAGEREPPLYPPRAKSDVGRFYVQAHRAELGVALHTHEGRSPAATPLRSPRPDEGSDPLVTLRQNLGEEPSAGWRFMPSPRVILVLAGAALLLVLAAVVWLTGVFR